MEHPPIETQTDPSRSGPGARLALGARTRRALRVAAWCCAALLALAACTPADGALDAGAVETGPLTRVVVTSVADGDTVHVRMPDGRDEKVRVIGIDAPEDTQRHDPYGAEATAYAERELLDRTVWLETDAELRDRYGRLLAYVWLSEPPQQVGADDVRSGMFEARMLSEGYASLLTVPPNVRYVDVLAPLQDDARREHRGLWGLDGD